MVDLIDAGKRSWPAVLGGQIGFHQLETGVVRTTTTHGLAYRGLVAQGAHRRTHLLPVTQQRGDQLRSQIAGPTGDQHRGGHPSTTFSSLGSSLSRSELAAASAPVSPWSRASQRAALARRYSRWNRRVSISISTRAAWRNSRSRCSPALTFP